MSKPIILSKPEVLRLQDGSGELRVSRAMKINGAVPKVIEEEDAIELDGCEFEAPDKRQNGKIVITDNRPPDILTDFEITCPYGVPGDKLWGREAWAVDESHDRVKARDLHIMTPVLYLADGRFSGLMGRNQIAPDLLDAFSPGVARSGVSMPWWAHRFNFEIMDVDIELLQDEWQWVIYLKKRFGLDMRQ